MFGKLPQTVRKLHEPQLTRYSCAVKNVTVVLEEAVARWARVWAARNETSLSQMRVEELKGKMQADRSYERAMRPFFSGKAKALKAQGSRYPKREALDERSDFR